jgi:hypothetical protein
MKAALDQILASYVRGVVHKQLERGAMSYKEQELLEQALKQMQDKPIGDERVTEKLARAGISRPESEEVKAGVWQIEEVEKLLTAGYGVEKLSYGCRLGVVCLVLYCYGVPLSKLAQWVGVNKTTIWRWTVGLCERIGTEVSGWIESGVLGVCVYADEKWIKIRKRWRYWFVVMDNLSGLPLMSELLAGTSYANCSYVVLRLKGLYPSVRVLVTDGLAGYRRGVLKWWGGLIHQNCLFHYQKGVSRWLREHLKEESQRNAVRSVMKEVFHTRCAKTVIRRLVKLYEASELLGIKGWVEQTLEKLPVLLPTFTRQGVPNTSNVIGRFFRAFNRFYKLRGGFHSKGGAKAQLVLFMVFYVFSKQECDGKAPLERVLPQVAETPLYEMINNPLRVLMGLWQEGREPIKSQPKRFMAELRAS